MMIFGRHRNILMVLGGLVLTASYTNCSPGFVASEELASSEAGFRPFTCESGTPVAAAPSRRLTSREYKNSMISLFSNVYASTRDEVRTFPDDIPNTNHLVMDFDTAVRRAASLSDIEAYAEVARTVSEGVASGVETRNDRTGVIKLLGSDCLKESANGVEDSCWTQTLTTVGRKITRRPLEPETLGRLIAIAKDPSNASRYEGLSLALQVMLQSYSFLYLYEGGTKAGFYALDDFEIASRMSYAVLGTTPSDELLDAAQAGKLKSAATRGQIAESLLQSSESKGGLSAFYTQWLRLQKLPYFYWARGEGVDPDDLSANAGQDVIDFADHITRTTHGDFAELMTSNLIFPKTPAVAGIYGVGVSNSPVPAQGRPGILTRAAVLMNNGNGLPNHVSRGTRLYTDMLCQSMGPPPDAAFTNILPFDPLSSSRQQVAAKTNSNSCMGCHSVLNPAGFAFGSFDGLGRARTSETITDESGSQQTRVHGIDTSGTLKVGNQTIGVSDVSDIANFMANSEVAMNCMSRRYYQYASGVSKPAANSCAAANMSRGLIAPGGTLRSMMKSYFTSNELIYRNVKLSR